MPRFGYAWGGAEMYDAWKLLENAYDSSEGNVWKIAVSLIENPEINLVNYFHKSYPKDFDKGINVTDIIEYFKVYKKEVKKSTKSIKDLSVRKTIKFVDSAINDLSNIVETRARNGNAFYRNYLSSNFPSKYRKLENERKVFEKRMAKVDVNDLPL